MDKVEVKVADSYKKLSLVFSVDNQSSAEIDTSVTQRILDKKKLNIPICDIHADKDYERNISNNFSLQSSYVKHCKKIGDEVDVSIDYVMDSSDKQWVTGLVKIEYGKEMQKLLVVCAFETIINILERYTAFSVQPIPLEYASKLILEQLKWNLVPTVDSLIKQVYAYWKDKRARIAKPLCRRYWPQIASSDCNPHQVFRTRDKEKYRLRKTQKRNDVEAFRKMQQLRKDFSKAKVLLELVLERETLREADFEVQREIFDQRLHDMRVGDQPEDIRPRRREAPFTHSLKFEHFDPDEEPNSSSGGGGKQQQQQPPSFNNHLLSCSSEDSYDMEVSPPPKKQQHHQGSSNGGHSGPSGVKKSSSLVDLSNTVKKGAPSVQLNGSVTGENRKSLSASNSALAVKATVEKKTTPANPVEKKKKKDSSRMVMYTVSNGQTVELGTGNVIPNATFASATASSSSSSSGAGGLGASNHVTNGNSSSSHAINAVDSSGGTGASSSSNPASDDIRIIHPNLDGPPGLCQPAWPTFMAPLPVRDSVITSTHRSYSNYLDDLELRRDPVTGRVVPPEKYRSRCRVGRGGRLVMDRIPVYSTPLVSPDYWTSSSRDADDPPSLSDPLHGDVTYIYPTSTRHQQFAAVLASHNHSLKTTAAIASSTAVVASPDNMPKAQQPQYTSGSTRLPEVPLSNRKILKYNIKVRNNNQLMAGAASVNGTAVGVLQQRIPTDLPSFIPSVALTLPQFTRQRLSEICAESDSEDERVVVPKAMKGYPELERSTITKASLAAAAAGSIGALLPDSSNNHSSNIKYSIRV